MILVKQIEELRVGQFASLTKTFSAADIALYVALTNDFSPIHINAAYADATRFAERIVPGILVSGLLTSTMATALVGCLPVSTSDTFNFLAPVHIGDTITATLTIAEIDLPRRAVRLDGQCVNQDGVVVVTADAHMKFPRSSPSSSTV
jgi:3-hydroxybutyryl-CoA dehydratase